MKLITFAVIATAPFLFAGCEQETTQDTPRTQTELAPERQPSPQPAPENAPKEPTPAEPGQSGGQAR